MASKLELNDEYKTHHRYTVNLEQQLNAVYDKKDWNLTKFEYMDSENMLWKKGGDGTNVQAFEEKFNVFAVSSNPFQRNLQRMMSRKIDDNHYENREVTVSRPPRHSYTQAWYGHAPFSLAGVAIFKDFGEYTFTLFEQRRNDITETFGFEVLDEEK